MISLQLVVVGFIFFFFCFFVFFVFFWFFWGVGVGWGGGLNGWDGDFNAVKTRLPPTIYCLEIEQS